MALTPFPEESADPRPLSRKKQLKRKQPVNSKHLSAIEEKDAAIRIESISSGLSSTAESPSESLNGIFESQTISPPFGQPLQRELMLDPFGLPLSPQPLLDGQDPLSWTQKKKIIILIQISILSFLAQFLAMDIVSPKFCSCESQLML
jgi:hypothetical protein